MRPLLLSLLFAACSVPELGYAGKTCEAICPASLVCIDGTCEALESSVYVSGFRFEWATPNSIRWAWTLEGPGEELASYELELRREGANPVTVVLTSADLPELGGYQLRRSDGFDVLTGVITPGLDSASVHAAVLRVNDIHGKQFVSKTVRGSTDAPRTSRMIVFDDALPGGAYQLPPSPVFARVTDGGVEGSAALRYRASQAPAVDFENLRVGGLDLSPDSTLTPKLFESAYLEFWIRGKGTASSSWCDLWVRLKATADHPCATPSACIWHFPAKWVYRPDATGAVFQRVQIPLSAFTQQEGANAPFALGDISRGLNEVNVGIPFIGASDEAFLDRVAFFW